MVLTKEIVSKINEFVYAKPRTIEEIARLLKVNWRTANRYVEKISKEEGTISTRVFREGTPGALKIVFWNNIEKLHASEIQERFFKQMEAGRRKEDFSPSEIYQFVDGKKKKMLIMNEKDYTTTYLKEYINNLKSAERQILFFSGNLTFSTKAYHDKKIRDVLLDLAEKKIFSRILARVELAGIENILDVLSINKKVGYDAVEIRHCFQPLRATLIDDKIATFKEVFDPKDYEKGELKERTYIIYNIYDEKWIEWLQKVFWYLFRNSLDARKRIEELKPLYL